MKKRILQAVSLLCMLVLLFALSPVGAAARGLEDVQSEIKEKKQQLETLAANIKANQNNKSKAEGMLKEYETEYNKMILLIDEQQALIEKRSAELDHKVLQLSLTMESIQQNKTDYETRLRAIYEMNSNQGMLAALMQVESFAEFAMISDAMGRISKRDTEMLENMQNQQTEYESQRLELEATIEDLAVQLEQYQENRAECEKMIAQMQQQIAAANLAIASSQQESARTDEEIKALQAEYNEIFRKLQEEASKKGDGSTRYDGSMGWPVPGHSRITSVFGDPRSNTGSHYGIDIPAPTGTSIVAVAPGTVVTATFHYSYGNYIVIDHGDGLRTLYAHCNALYVGKGAYVEKGQSIAAVGNTGDSYGAHLHIEVHDNGTRQNPLGGYLSL